MDERSDSLICLDEANFNQCELHISLYYACVAGESTSEVFILHSRNFEREECQNVSEEYYSLSSCPLKCRRGARVTLNDLTKANWGRE